MTREQTNPILLKAMDLTKAYACATKTRITIHDDSYLPIPEMAEKVLSDKNTCLFCIKYQKNMEVNKLQDLHHCPCREMHINALKESHQYGGSHSYVCPLGFQFWTSPIYENERFVGALMGSGFLGAGQDEVCDRMHKMSKGNLSKTEIEDHLKHFPRAEPRKMEALSELLFICSKSLSARNQNCYTAMKRRALQQSELSAKIEELKNLYPAGTSKPEYPIDKEQKLLYSIKQGDIITGKGLLNEILAVIIFSGPGDFISLQYRGIELAALLSRVDMGPGLNTRLSLETINSYNKTILEAANVEDLTDALHRIVEDLAVKIQSFQGIHHPSALKKAEYFILENFTRKISLEEIAKASGFSAPYFSTIFKEEMGENLSSYLNRLRVEKAKIMIKETNLALSLIARNCGFEDQSWFSKIFKNYTGVSPGKYRQRSDAHKNENNHNGFY